MQKTQYSVRPQVGPLLNESKTHSADIKEVISWQSILKSAEKNIHTPHTSLPLLQDKLPSEVGEVCLL